MKQFAAVTLCLLISGTAFAQTNATGVKRNPNKSGIAGTIKNMHKKPIAGIRAFVYKKDSIAASGFTDSTGYFETGFVIPGTYDLKLVYPSDKLFVIQAVPVKARTITMTDLRTEPPAADTAISYSVIAPKLPPPAPKESSRR